MSKILVHMMIATLCINDGFSIDPSDICPKPLEQNTAVPWAAKLQSDRTDLKLRSMDVGRLLDCVFINSPKLKVCAGHVY